MGDLTEHAAHRLYEVSRDLLAPALAAFAAEWLDELAEHSDAVAVCLARDGLAPFLAARTLMRTHPRRFRHVAARRVRLAYVSRALAHRAAADTGEAVLLDRYLRTQGVSAGSPLVLVDVGIHGSIQDCLRTIYPERALRGRYLLLRRRSGDPNGAHKGGFLADLDVAPSSVLTICASCSSEPELGGTLRHGHGVFLKPRSVRVFEDLWNGVGEGAVGYRVLPDARVAVVRGRREHALSFAPMPVITPRERTALKCAALRGVVDGVARAGQAGQPRDGGRGAAARLAEWFRGLDDPATLDAFIVGALLRVRRADESSEYETS